MPSQDLATATAHELAIALAAGQVLSTDLVTGYLERIAKYNGSLHAVISTAPRDLVLSIADRLDQERADGHVRGPLHGIPIILKDNIATRPALGMETTAGTFALVGSVVKDSAPLVTRLEEAGLIILGKANLSELSNYRGFRMPCGWSAVGGLTQSPYVDGGKQWDDGFGGHSSCGGSSSGSCVAVAAGLASVSIGTETNGSLLMPASRNDVYAMKPTLGLVDVEGIVPICREFDSAGPIARCAADIAHLMDVMLSPAKLEHLPEGGYRSQLTGSLQGLRIGVLDPADWHLPGVVAQPSEDFDKQQEADILRAYGKLVVAGASVRRVQLPSLDGLEVDGMSHIARVMNSGFKTEIENYLASLETTKVRTLDELMHFMTDHADQEFPPESPNMVRLEGAAKYVLSAAERKHAIDEMTLFGRKAIDGCLTSHNVDVILEPADIELDDYYCAAGYPMAHLPLSYSKHNGRPFGVCAMASRFQEGLLVRLMSGWEQAIQTSRQPPEFLETTNSLQNPSVQDVDI